jgi:mycofactocin system glycosyltransferase
MAARSPGVPAPPADRALPEGFRIRLDTRVRRWADGSVLVGGSPWRISRLKPPAQDLLRRLSSAGSAGLVLHLPMDLTVARMLLDRGFAVPLPNVPTDPCPVPAIVIPAMDHADNLESVLTSLDLQRAVVVDDGSRDPDAISDVVRSHGARLIRHGVNRGPAAARNSGLAATDSPVVAFIDSDCIAAPGWPGHLLYHFEDPGVAAVASRVASDHGLGSVLDRYDATHSSLDMGGRPELVRPGARLGFVPSAALLVRRSALAESGFDEELRLGEDVDLIWRLTEAGWLVRYDPDSVVRHRPRPHLRDWIVRKYEYGTSAADLEARHAGRLTPARVSAWNLATLALFAAGQPVVASAVTVAATAMFWRQVRDLPRSPQLAARTVGQGLLADSAGIGHLLRREWWPLGAAALLLAPTSRTARVATACMLAPIALEWAAKRPDLDPLRYAGLRLIDDAAYGSGVISSAVRARRWATLLPHVRWPGKS